MPSLSYELSSVLNIRRLLEAKQTASITEVQKLVKFYTTFFFSFCHPGERQLVEEQIPNTQTEV